MKEFEYVITDPVGIHARPAGNLVKEIKNYADSKISITKGEKTVDGLRLMAVMGLGAKQGDTVKFTVEGGDEDAVVEALSAWLKENL
ncbi:MAG: HPr family phosphocarrier protein [Oscillospiraceae bacterium]|jgi:phosphocarrier protein|nr:HPr family phosphocarrier protein [Oscillospiraceae bacterium]MBQ5340935.1 HPr family phosphocarrier protein [Oscillospiraceae bacterium]MBR4827419.1 HPr family phosphocarrier protein [Oscillospiraceae bacterium]MBR5064753.1 HPr family phosphocarrier protein [Oscillospiraceae bacterium]